MSIGLDALQDELQSYLDGNGGRISMEFMDVLTEHFASAWHEGFTKAGRLILGFDDEPWPALLPLRLSHQAE